MTDWPQKTIDGATEIEVVPRAEVERLRDALLAAVVAARLFNRNGMTWMEYDRELARLEAIARRRAFDEDRP